MADSIKFIKIPGGPFMARTSSGLQTIADQDTLKKLSSGQIPYSQEELGSNTIAPSVYNPSLTPNAQPPQQPADLQPNVPQVDSTDPITKFNLIVMDMLRKAQSGAGNEDLYSQQRGLQRAAISRSSAMTPEELRVLSPSQQEAIRSGKIGALEPEIDAVAAKIKAQDSRLSNFENMLSTIKDIGGDLLKNVAPSPEILAGYQTMIRAGADFTSIPEEIRNKVVSKLTPDDWAAYSQAKAAQKAAERAPVSSPTSYNEWQLAGGLEGTGKTYAQFIDSTQAKPANQAQYTVAGYANRMEQANDVIGKLEQTIATYNPATYAIQTNQLYPNYLKTADIQSIEQAERNFVNAILRRESGAAIAASEFESAQKQYFPLPGDSKQVLEQKKQNRLMSIKGLVSAAGSAYEPASLSNGGTVSGTVIMTRISDGKQFKVPVDKVEKFKANGYK